MSDQHASKVPGKPHRWQKGESGNLRGRPRAGLALAERIRERLDPDLVIDLALALAADETVSVERRLAALLPFAQLGYLRPPSAITATIETTGAPVRDWSAVPIGERRDLLARLRAVPELAGDGDLAGEIDGAGASED